MCLDYAHIRSANSDKGVCFKIFKTILTNPIPKVIPDIYRTPIISGEYELNVVYINPQVNMMLKTRDGKDYRSGYHAFLKLDDAKKYAENTFGVVEQFFKIIKCEYENITAVGYQDSLLTIVFQKLTLKEVL